MDTDLSIKMWYSISSKKENTETSHASKHGLYTAQWQGRSADWSCPKEVAVALVLWIAIHRPILTSKSNISDS